MSKIEDALARLDELDARRKELRQQLQVALAIQAFMPDAFEHGSCKVGGRSTERDPEKGTVVFTLGNGAKREFPAAEVPFALWPYTMRLAYESKPKHLRGKIRG